MFPAETTAAVSPSPTDRTARTSDASGLARTASAGFSCMAISSVLATSSSPRGSSDPGPKSTGSIVLEAAWTAPAITSSGAWSPPSASTATRTTAPEARTTSTGPDGRGKPRPYGAGARSGWTSRPRYVLHVGQTRCDCFGEPQFSQVETRGAEIACWARRLSRRAFEVFRFGTAMSGRPC